MTQTKEDIIVSLRYMDRLLGLRHRQDSDGGARDEGVSTCPASWPPSTTVWTKRAVPDLLTITDCLAVGGPGLGCGGAGLGASVISAQVIGTRELGRGCSAGTGTITPADGGPDGA